MKLVKILLFSFCFLLAFEVKAAPYIVVDVKTGGVLSHNEAFDRWYPASLTKMMTAYVTFRAMRLGMITKKTRVKVSPLALTADPIRSGYRVETVMTMDTALKIIMAKSTNDLTIAIAEAVYGSQEAFIAHMNFEADRLGMFGTHFSNTNGLPDSDNYSTARDLAVLAVQIRREFPQHAHYFGIAGLDFGDGRRIEPNSNNLLGRFRGADGMKTGFICSSGFNLAASSTRNRRTLIAIVLGAARVEQREERAARLLENGFRQRGLKKVTLANMPPYGYHLFEASDMRELLCSIDAWKKRVPARDEEGNIIFNSPFIALPALNPNFLKVHLISVPPLIKNKQIADRKKPIPRKRPVSVVR